MEHCRAAWGVNPPGDAFLVSSGTDLVRGPDGSWLVLADRTQAPSGRGYAFENRSIIAEVFGETLESCRVQRLGSFFHAERDALRFLAPTRRGSPGVVLMTPGPYNETYFEHVYLARELGLTLVEGADLTVHKISATPTPMAAHAIRYAVIACQKTLHSSPFTRQL